MTCHCQENGIENTKLLEGTINKRKLNKFTKNLNLIKNYIEDIKKIKNDFIEIKDHEVYKKIIKLNINKIISKTQKNHKINLSSKTKPTDYSFKELINKKEDLKKLFEELKKDDLILFEELND